MKYVVFKYLWLIAVLPKMVQLPIMGIILLCMWREARETLFLRNIKSDLYFLLLLICTAIHGFSIVANSVTGQYDAVRIMAAANTFSITCVALGFYYVYSQIEVDSNRVCKYMFINMNIQFGLFLLYCMVGDEGNLPILGVLSGWDQVVPGVDTTRFECIYVFVLLCILCGLPKQKTAQNCVPGHRSAVLDAVGCSKFPYRCCLRDCNNCGFCVVNQIR